MSRGRKRFITSLTLLGLSVFLCASPAAEALTVSSQMAAGLDDRAPGPVGEVNAELNLDGTSVTISWTLADDDFVRQAPAGGDFTSGGVFINVNDVESYGIWRQTVGFGDPELIDEVDAGETTYVDETVITAKPIPIWLRPPMARAIRAMPSSLARSIWGRRRLLRSRRPRRPSRPSTCK